MKERLGYIAKNIGDESINVIFTLALTYIYFKVGQFMMNYLSGSTMNDLNTFS